jgi:acetolactate synthase-1/2/3 large subunit
MEEGSRSSPSLSYYGGGIENFHDKLEKNQDGKPGWKRNGLWVEFWAKARRQFSTHSRTGQLGRSRRPIRRDGLYRAIHGENVPMTPPIDRREALKAAAITGLAALLQPATAEAAHKGEVSGHMTGARALVEALKAEGTSCVFGIPGAQENELWDEFKARHLPYLLVTHEFSAACMADGAARVTGRPGVLCVVPGPGITNALSGIGEALLDSVPIVCIACDVARGKKYRPFQVHDLPGVDLLRPVCKCVLEVTHVSQIPDFVRRAFALAMQHEPGPVAVVVPYNLLLESCKYDPAPAYEFGIPFDECAFGRALAILSDRRLRVGIYAGMGCMDHSESLTRLAETLQAPVATSVSGKGAIDECHPLAVGWGYGPQGTATAECAFKRVDVVLAIGVKFSEVSTGSYSLPKHRHLIHVDANADNLGKVMKTDVCVHADSGVFLARLLEERGRICRAGDEHLLALIKRQKAADAACHSKVYARCGIDPLALILALRKAACEDALVFTDVALAEHLAAESFVVRKPRTYFNPVDNQSMGWSIPAAIGAQRVAPGRQVVTLTGDGCMLMSAMELLTAARESLPVKFFVLDNQVYYYMQVLQEKAYRRTTATILGRIDYPSLCKGLGIGHVALDSPDHLEASIRGILEMRGPVLVSVPTDYGKRKIRWIEAVSDRFTEELSAEQKVRFLARLGRRATMVKRND